MAPVKKPQPIDPKNDHRRDFIRRVLPWLAAGVMLVVFAATRNHWVSLINLYTVGALSGWHWLPEISHPLYMLVTLPLRLLPTAEIPAAVNLFSLLCAALALLLLARSVAILPFDRTDALLARERSAFTLLTIRSAWMPPVLAVLLCAFQLTFWERATNGGEEMFDLLMFAVVIWQLLEYRLDQKERRLFLSSFIVGLGIAEGPSMTGFFFVYIIAIIWARGYSFFNWHFLKQMTLCGLAGFLLFLLLPVWALISGNVAGQFWGALKFALTPQYEVFKQYFNSIADIEDHFEDMILPLFIALVPVLLLAIRWEIGDKSKMGSKVANFMFHSIHSIFLVLCLVLMFDPPFSPREKNFMLTLYYLIALSAGYYAGYLLLIFGKKHPRAGEFPPIFTRLFNWGMVAGVWLLAIVAVCGLVEKNAPIIRADNNETLSQFTSLITADLPRAAIVLSDDPATLYLTQAALTREGRAKNYLLLETGSLVYPQYHRYLHKESPGTWPLLIAATNNSTLNPVGMIAMLTMLSGTNELYYLQPSFGYYFEKFYAEPHGLLYKLQVLPNDTLLPVPPAPKLIAENKKFWAMAKTNGLEAVENALVPPPVSSETIIRRVLVRLLPQEPDFSAIAAGAFCSRSLDFWGVTLQRSGDLTNAAAAFKTALRLNPDNAVAQINLDFDAQLSANVRPFVDLNKTSSEHLGKFTSVVDAIRAGGPFDEPSFCFYFGFYLAQGYGWTRQAAEQFERVYEFDPGYLPARLWLARIYSLNYLPDRVIDVLRAPLERPQEFSVNDTDLEEITGLSANAYFQKNNPAEGSRLFGLQISRDPTNDELLGRVARIYSEHGMLSDVLAMADRRLSRSPNDIQWLLIKGHTDNQLKKYNDAIPLLSRVIALQTNNAEALADRGYANLNSGDLNAARADYKNLQRFEPNSSEAAYGFGEIAWQQHETNEAIRNLTIYLANAETNTPEARQVAGQLRDLKPPTGGE